jgi:hypothetical protein
LAALATVQSHAVQGSGEVEVEVACVDLGAAVLGGDSPAALHGGSVGGLTCGGVGLAWKKQLFFLLFFMKLTSGTVGPRQQITTC